MKRSAELIVKLKMADNYIRGRINCILCYQVKNLTINSDIMSSLPDDDHAASLYKRIGASIWWK